MVELQVRPGFNLDVTYKGHAGGTPVRALLRNRNNGTFISGDDKSLKAWTFNLQQGTTNTVHNVVFPGYQSTFFTSMCLAERNNMLFAACLDGNLRLYSEKLRLLSAMPWHNGLVRDMAYDEANDELITAGSGGIKVWACEFDTEGYKADTAVRPYALPRTKDGKVIPWCLGMYQSALCRLTLRWVVACLVPCCSLCVHAHGQMRVQCACMHGSVCVYNVLMHTHVDACLPCTHMLCSTCTLGRNGT